MNKPVVNTILIAIKIIIHIEGITLQKEIAISFPLYKFSFLNSLTSEAIFTEI